MIRKKAVELIAKEIGNEPIISANGFMSRDLYETNEKENNFYMIGSMGLASSIGLGVALKNHKKKIHIFFDNKSHESTGGQPTNSSIIKLEKIAQAAKFKTFKISKKSQIKEIILQTKKKSGPILIIIEVEKSKTKSIRVNISPLNIKTRFMKSLKSK